MTRARLAYPGVLVFALAAVLAATALAKPIQEIDATVTPAKGGTKKKPTKVKTKISLTTRTDTYGEAEPTTQKVEVFLPSEFIFGGAAFPSCTFAHANQDQNKCSPKAKVGRGTAQAGSGTVTSNMLVTVYNGPKGKSLIIRLDSSSPVSIHQALEGKLHKAGEAGFGHKLVTSIPEELQEVAGLPIAMTNLSFTVNAVSVKKKGVPVPFVGLGPCSDKELKFKTVNTYKGVTEKGIGEDTVDCR